MRTESSLRDFNKKTSNILKHSVFLFQKHLSNKEIEELTAFGKQYLPTSLVSTDVFYSSGLSFGLSVAAKHVSEPFCGHRVK